MNHGLHVIWDALPQLLRGMRITAEVTVLALLIASVLGLLLCVLTMSRFVVLRGIARIYINTIRGTPLLVQILFFYFGLPSLLHIHLGLLTSGTLTMGLYTTAYMSEIFRSGIRSVDPGQFEGAAALGLSTLQSMRLVVLPQAIKTVIPAFVNQFSMTIKDTSLLSVIGVSELTFQGEAIYSANFETFPILTGMGILYFVMVYILTLISRLLERRMARS